MLPNSSSFSAPSAPSALKFPAPTPEISTPQSSPVPQPPPSPSHWLFAKSIPLPPLPDSFQDQAAHDKLLADYLDWTGNYVQLAQKHGLDFDTFDRWLHSDIIQTRIKRIDAMSDVRAKTLAKQHRAVAITRLVEIVEDTRSSPVRDRVRAASQILKAAEKADNRELQEAKAAAKRALTKVATTKIDDELSPSSSPRSEFRVPRSPEGGAGVGSVPPPTTEAGHSTTTVPPQPSSVPHSAFRVPSSPEAGVGPAPHPASDPGRSTTTAPPSSIPRSVFRVPRSPLSAHPRRCRLP